MTVLANVVVPTLVGGFMVDRILTVPLPPFQLNHIQSAFTHNTTTFVIESVGPIGNHQSTLWLGMVILLWCWSVIQSIVMIHRNTPRVAGNWLFVMVTHVWCLTAWLMQGTRAPWEMCASLAWLDSLIWVLIIQGCSVNQWMHTAVRRMGERVFQLVSYSSQPSLASCQSSTPQSKFLTVPSPMCEDVVSSTNLDVALDAKLHAQSCQSTEFDNVRDTACLVTPSQNGGGQDVEFEELSPIDLDSGTTALPPISTHWNWVLWIGLNCWLVFGVCFVSAWWRVKPHSVWPIPLLLMPCLGQLLAMYDHQRGFTWISHLGGVLLPLFTLELLL
jgi:hypothetical protein